MEYSSRFKIAADKKKRIANLTTTATHLNYRQSKASFTSRPVLGDTTNAQQKNQPIYSNSHKHDSISVQNAASTTETAAAAPPLNVNEDCDPAYQILSCKRRRLQDDSHQQSMIPPFSVLPIQLPEHLHSPPIAFTPYSTTSIKQWSPSSSLSSIANRLRTRLYEKGVPPLHIFDFSNRPYHRPIEPFACAKNRMGWINTPAVVEYEHDIYQHLRNIELKSLPDQDYANYHHHKDFDWDTHNSLMDWMIALHSRFRLLPETLYLSINIANRFLSRKLVPMDDLSLIIITSLVIGCKYEEGLTPSIPQLITFTGEDYTEKELYTAERYMLDAIHYNLAYPNPLQFWRRIIKDQPYDRITSTIAQYLIQTTCVDYHFLHILPSKIAAAAVYLSRFIARRYPLWTKEFTEISGYSDTIELKQVAQLMVNYLSKPIENTILFRKWNSKQLLGISSHVRNWILLYRNKRSK